MTAKSENVERADKLAEYMEKRFGVTPENIDAKLAEMREELCNMGLERSVGK